MKTHKLTNYLKKILPRRRFDFDRFVCNSTVWENIYNKGKFEQYAKALSASLFEE